MIEIATFKCYSDLEKRVLPIYEQIKDELIKLIPVADIQHIGATSVSGSLTKGDIDIAVRVADSAFEDALTSMDSYATRHTESLSTESYQPYTCSREGVDIGIQLFVVGTVFDKRFLKWRDMLRNDAALLQQYNELKNQYDGQEMSVYREAKSSFIQKHLGDDA